MKRQTKQRVSVSDVSQKSSSSLSSHSVEISGLKKIYVEEKSVGVVEKKSKELHTLEIIEKIWAEAANGNPLLRLNLDENVTLDGRYIQVLGKKLVNFSSCSYFGLELDETVKIGAKKAIDTYGVQFSSTRAAVAIDLVQKVEENLKKIFGHNTLLTPTTTHAHLSAIPLLVNDGDVVLIDQQVHNSVQMALQLLAKKQIFPVIIPHNNIEVLEKNIQKLSLNSNKIWFFCDGVYSIYGDVAPIKKLQFLQKKYKKLHLYIDDAHGIGVYGDSGRGFALSELDTFERVIVATSTSKCFGCSGGALIIPDISDYLLILKFGQPLIFGGPIHPPMLGALYEVSKIFLSEKLKKLQEDLQKKISLRNELLIQNQIPVVGPSNSPLTFVEIGSHVQVGHLFRRLFEEGLFVNPALFPVVGRHHNGIRFTTTLHQKDSDIEKLISRLKVHISDLVSANK